MIDAPARRLLLLLWHTTQHGAHEDVPWPGGWRSCSAFFTHAETKRNTAVGGGFTQLLMPKTANLKRGRWTKLPSPCSQRFTAHHHVVQHLFDLSRYVFGSLGQPPPAGCIIQIGPNFLMELIIIWTCWISPMRTCQKSLQKSPIFQDKAPKLQQKKTKVESLSTGTLKAQLSGRLKAGPWGDPWGPWGLLWPAKCVDQFIKQKKWWKIRV